MTDEQVFELAEKIGFQDDFGRWNFTSENLLDFVFMVQKAEREWVGLTRQEFEQCVDGLEDLEDCWVAIEAKLKEKNNG